jgi:hypothetical protein
MVRPKSRTMLFIDRDEAPARPYADFLAKTPRE